MQLAKERKEGRLNKMYNKILKKTKTFLGLYLSLTFLFVLFLFQPTAYAQTESLSLNIRQNISINSPYAKPKESFFYVMEALSKDAPLPEKATKSYKFKLKGDSEKNLDIKFHNPGEYEYKIYQEDPKMANVKYDKEVYKLYVKITKSNGSLLKDGVLIRNSSDKKIENISFENIYNIKEVKEEKPTTKKPGVQVIPGYEVVVKNGQIRVNKVSKNAKTGVEDYIIPLALIVFIASLLLILTRKRKN